MKYINKSMTVLGMLSLCTFANAQELSQALKNATISGDVNIMFESREQDKEILPYYANTKYSKASLGLNYKSSTFYDFSLALGFRTYTTIYEDDKNFISYGGRGDSSERYDTSEGSTLLTNAYIQYEINNLNIKAGRQNLTSEWLSEINDAISIYIQASKDLEIEFIWTKARGDIDTRDLIPVRDVNENKGLYKTALTYKLNNNIKANAYFMTAPDLYDFFGTKLTLDTKIASQDFNFVAHVMQTREHEINNTYGINKEDGKMLQLVANTLINAYSLTLGYIKIGEKNGLGSAWINGDYVVPFEEGDQIYGKDSKTIYASVYKNFNGLDLTAIYGESEYSTFKKSEFNLWAYYKIYKNLAFDLGYAKTFEDSGDVNTTDLNQINFGLTYNF